MTDIKLLFFIVNKAKIGIRGSELKLYEMENIASCPILPIIAHFYPYCQLLPSGPGNIHITQVFANPYDNVKKKIRKDLYIRGAEITLQLLSIMAAVLISM